MNKSSGTSPKSKPSTRSSIRLSLGLAGKALADVISKDSSAKDGDKSNRKVRDNPSRRLSGIALPPTGPRSSMGDFKSPSQVPNRTGTPDSKTVTRRRVSAGLGRASMDEQSSSASETVSRNAILRPRTAGSALPKYRPKSTLIESTKPMSPTTGSRRPRSCEDEKEDQPPSKNDPSSEKLSRPISPLPHRAALKSNIRTVNATPQPTTPTRTKPSATSQRTSPTRPTKLAKVSTPTSPSAIPRPSSSTSSSSSPTRTPKTAGLRNPTSARPLAQNKSSRVSPSFGHNESFSTRHSRTFSKQDGSPAAGNMSHISEGDSESENSELEDVALLLAPVAPLGAPTPAMPKLQNARTRKRLPPQTPTRNNVLPTRANMSYLSPLPPDINTSSSSLRPPQQGPKQGRGSILSWEQLASEASKSLGEDEINRMLADIPAPFHPDAVSPTPSHAQLDIPESPCLSALSSPGGYGSISQVLLPDVTPSPAVHPQQISRFDLSAELPVVDAATVTLLRLQLAAAENLAKDRLTQLQYMEEEIHNLKQSRGRETLHLAEQVALLEQQLKGSLEIRERADEERAIYTRTLEEQLQQEKVLHSKALEAAVVQRKIKSQRDPVTLISSAYIAATEWSSVRALAEMELDIIREEQQILSFMLTQSMGIAQPIL
ncbi:hypothetical protein H0H93_013012 [Arthromyces matolae]|nr:hypothetical protein H0H93_013012 [Arthromyces matolae]